MLPSPKKSTKNRALCLITPCLPCTSWLKGAVCSHLQSLWIGLMGLTVLCVAIQILGVGWQYRNEKTLSDKLLKVRFTFDLQRTPTMEYQIWERLRSLPASVIEEEVTSLEEGVSRQQFEWRKTIAERQDGREVPVKIVTEHHLTNNFSKGKEPRKEVWVNLLALNASVSKARVVNDQQNLRVPWSVALRSEGTLNHPANRVSSTLPQKPPNTPRTSQRKSTKSHSLQGTTSSRIHSVHSNSVNSLAARPISAVKPEVATSTCRPKNHIFFLKTHKTASSTILNILYRYGDSRNLTFALPLNQHSQLFYPYFFTSYFVEGVRSQSVKEFHIMCNHMRFRKTEVRAVMPQDTFYFSILRNPIAMMESIFIYYKSIPAFHKVKSLDDFLNNSWRSYNTSLSNNHYARNILTFDFGFDNNVDAETPEELETRTAQTIGAIEQDFHLILISEYFDESMILLKHALCWSLDDIVSFKLNSRSDWTRHTLSLSTADKIQAWNNLDWQLYLHFNATFWRRVDITMGRETMKQQVKLLQERRAQLAKTCLKDGGAVDPSQVKDTQLRPFQYGAAIIQGYNLNPGLDEPTKKLCQKLITPELQYTDILYTKQFPELAAKHKLAAKLATSQRQTGSAKVSQNRLREARHSRTARNGPRYIQNQNNLLSTVQTKHIAPRIDRNMP